MKSKPNTFTVLTVALFSVPLLAQQSTYPPEMPGARVETYKSVSSVDLNVWIFEPENYDSSDQRPAIVFFYGGGWSRGTPAQFLNQAKYLASRGMVAMAADYRVLSRHQTKPNIAVQDAKAAIRWVRTNADRLGVDPDRIAASGSSTGGHLAAATAMLPAHDDPTGDQSISALPNALVLFNPAVILAPIPGRFETREWPSAESRGAPLESMSPYHHVKAGQPPTIIFHGKADATVPYEYVELFTEAMTTVGNRCELVGYEGEEHGFFNYWRGDGSAYTDTVHRTAEFFVSLGWLPES